ncbi:MAG TPA: efflux RND transporter periplasmic adaptor subunit [Gemmataceae bacterium]|nr:efflux RND transporter periplasmic adaptor subunit [Gemmataceae bacterium]
MNDSTPTVEAGNTSAIPAASPIPPAHNTMAVRRRMNRFFAAVRSAGLLLIVVVVLMVFLGFSLGVRVPGMAAAPEEMKIEPPRRLGVDLVKDQPHTLFVPEEVRSALGIRKGGIDRIEVVQAPTQTRPFSLYGNTKLDETRLARIRARFAPCEVVQIGKTVDPEHRTESGETAYRELRNGDRVKKGDILGVFFSVDVGCKKNDLLDALVQYKLDQRIYDKQMGSPVIPELALEMQFRNVQSDRNAINRALNNLKVWNIPQDEIDALHAEAERISADKDAWFKTPEGRWVKGEKQAKSGQVDVDKENENPWARVTLRAPFDGIIVERNVTVKDMVVDNTVNLFQIAQVDRLQVIAYAPEDDLPTLNALKHDERVWTVQTVGANSIGGIKAPIDEIGYLIDPNQHTAIIKGYIPNPKEQIRAGQFVTCTIPIPPPEDVVEVPINALVEDGKYCVVFVQADPAKPQYTMRRVQPIHRFEKTAFVRSKPFAKNEQLTAEEKEMGMLPLEPLRPGERILRTGVGELKAALIDLESRAVKEKRS